jgi:hypothetical protein
MKKGFRYLDKELEQLFPVENGNAPKFVDKLVQVYTKQGKEEWILIHIEVQGYNDPHFARRMFTYFYRILDKYNKPVTAVAIFTGNNKKFHPAAYEYEYLGTKNTFQFNTHCIIDQDEQALANDDNPFATVLLTAMLAMKKKKLSDESLFSLKYTLAKNLLQKRFSRNKIDKLLIFLQLHVHFDNSAYNAKFDKAIQVLTNNGKTMGIREMVLDRAKKEGIQQGFEKGKTEVVKNLLLTGEFTIVQIANFAGVTEAFVRKVKKGQQ